MGIDCTPEERAILDNWPVVTGEDIEKMNDLFRHYIFFEKVKGDKITIPGVKFYASCCGHEETICRERRTEYPWQSNLLDACSHNELFTCPWCGRQVRMKDLSKSGQRKTLCQTELTMLLHGVGDALYADALVLRKDFSGKAGLTAKPEYWASSAYRFTIGDVMQIDYQVWGDGSITHEVGSLHKQKKVMEPFKAGNISFFQYEPYSILNRPALDTHPVFKYCQFFGNWQYKPGGGRGYRFKFHDFVSYMTAYCIYPRQVERFMKAGFSYPVSDLVYKRKKNADAINWAETDARKTLGLSKQELHQFMVIQPPLDCLAVKKYVKKHWGKDWPLSFCMDFDNLWGCDLSSMYVLSFLKRYRIDPEKFLRYLGGQFDECRIELVAYKDFFDTYRDYIEASYELGRCLEHTAVLYPPMLLTAHDEAVNALAKLRHGEPGERAPAGVRARRLKYEFAMDGLEIVFPLTARAIQREGKLLSHCVGGYAARHMKGTLSILFLRKSDAPGVPYVTIEMHGNSLQQIHGFQNDRGSVSPRITHKAFIDTWLAWLKKGSPRDEQGNPIIPKRRTKKEAVA